MWRLSSYRRERTMIAAAFFTTACGVVMTLLAALATLLLPLGLLAEVARELNGDNRRAADDFRPELLIWNLECVVLGILTAGAGWAMVRGLGRRNWPRYRKAAATATVFWVAWAVIAQWSPIPWIAESDRPAIAIPAFAAALTLYAALLSRTEG